MRTRWSYVWALLFVLLQVHVVLGGPFQVLGREDTSPTVTAAPTATKDAGKDIETSTEETTTTKPTRKHTADATSTVISTSETAFPSAINGNRPDNSSSSDNSSPIPDGQLPLQPRLTPGWGIAGAILLISGAVYTLIGIKNQWLHTFFSAAFLSGLSITVLILYVMAPPVPIAIEGAYVVAAVVPGVILGGAATIFSELTEGLGCLLGGFCISMWLLTLKPGGLLTDTAPKSIFIAAFSVGSYAFYFSRYTRPYALLGLMSFAGATVTVIGIDCFSRAGLKEFWAYIWNLNRDLFPYTADTYPLTKGIRVEIAVTVVLTIAGIISQLKLWQVIQQHRAKKAEAAVEEQRKRDEEEANIGMQLEAQNERELRQWETVYGDQQPRSSAASGDSGVEYEDDEKKTRVQQTVVRQVPSNEDGIEMSEIPTADQSTPADAAKTTADGLMMTNQNDDSKVTIRVARDDGPNGDDETTDQPEKKVWLVNGNGDARPSSTISSPRLSKQPGPEITPLPFKIPDHTDELDETHSRSSVATYAGEDDGAFNISEKPSRMSLTNRLSVGSGNLIRKLSQRSARAQTPRQKTGESGLQSPTKWDDSTEGLVEQPRPRSAASSLAATIDGLSLDGDSYTDPMKDDVQPIPAVTVESTAKSTNVEPNAVNKAGSGMKLQPSNHQSSLETRPISSAETVETDILNSSTGELSNSLHESAKKTESTNENTNPTEMNTIEEASETSPPPKSVAPSAASESVSLTKDRLPSALPRVALSYRTNEWAKHLSAAEAPPLEELQIEEQPKHTIDESKETEAPVPVRVEELQQTATGEIPGEAIMRSASNVSMPSQANRSVARVSSSSSLPKAHVPATLAILTGANPADSDSQAALTPQASHSFRNKGRRNSSEVYTQPIQEENGRLSVEQPRVSIGDESPISNSTPPSPKEPTPIPGVVSYNSPQTLLGRREMYLRNKSASQLFTIPPIQEHPNSRPTSQIASPYGYTPTPTPPIASQDADDIPMNQRKHLIRQSSALSLNNSVSGSRAPQRSSSWNAAVPTPPPAQQLPTITADSSHFDSHQPQRRSSRQSHIERDARLSHFRQSVAAELKAAPVQKQPAPMLRATSSASLAGPSTNNADVGRAIDLQRNMLLSQREQEGQRREMERLEKERQEWAFAEMMRRGDMNEAHRDAMRRMQGGVRHE
ncbi:hypothetical protein F4808DRAFT_60805 [Astrocystis sublimbata]|nr:hypothetical protein F4808DRAFT_60805 [Astrocystis sublimbata]